MKKILIIASILCIFTSSSYARTIEIEKIDGQNDKYQTIQEKHEDGGWFSSAKSTLKCYDPGTNTCEWTINPRTLPSMIGPNQSNPEWEDLHNYALDEIINGNFAGSFTSNVTINNDFWYRTVQWSGNNTNNCLISIEIQLAQLPNN